MVRGIVAHPDVDIHLSAGEVVPLTIKSTRSGRISRGHALRAHSRPVGDLLPAEAPDVSELDDQLVRHVLVHAARGSSVFRTHVIDRPWRWATVRSESRDR